MMSSNGGDLSDMSMMDLFRMEAENQCEQLSEDLPSSLRPDRFDPAGKGRYHVAIT